MAQAYWESPIGMIGLCADDHHLTSLTIGKPTDREKMSGSRLLDAAMAQLAEWFAGIRQDFDLPLAPTSTPRGAQLREVIAAIPYGKTSSYGALARTIDSGARAIGQACRTNRFPIIIPCHRVVAANGVIGHYSAADGPVTKSWLLDFEAHQQKRTSS